MPPLLHSSEKLVEENFAVYGGNKHHYQVTFEEGAWCARFYGRGTPVVRVQDKDQLKRACQERLTNYLDKRMKVAAELFASIKIIPKK
jgi:hypothetical protein